MTEQEEALCDQIRTAFEGVRLGQGVGLYEAQGLDDYADRETLGRLRSSDEKDVWSRISADELNRCESSLSFFDAEGMRFHLPAFLLADLRGEFHQTLSFRLTALTEYQTKQFALLSTQQRNVIRTYLVHISGKREHKFERSDILRSLDQYWTVADDA